MKVRTGISWNPKVDPVEEDRLEFLRMNDQERWDHMMRLILLTFPKDRSIEYRKRIIEWT